MRGGGLCAAGIRGPVWRANSNPYAKKRFACPRAMHVFMILLFWTAIALMAYIFIGYPLALAARGALRPRPWLQHAIEPNVSIVMAAHNEAASIEAKILNLLSLDYPAGRVEVLVGSDGSTDTTAEQLLAMSDPRIKIFVFPERRGKPFILNTLIPEARGDIILLADVRQKFDSSVLRALTKSFADPNVGAASGELVLTPNGSGTAAADGSGMYWRYEKFVRDREGLIDSTVGATGAIYAIRKSLFEPIPEDTILDDVLIPLRIARRGYRVVFDRQARAYDAVAATGAQEFARKVRTLAGNFQLFAREHWLLNPIRNRLWWQTISHKVLRLLIPLIQLIILATNTALASTYTFYRFTLICQILFYVSAISGCVLPRDWKRPHVVTLPYFICLLSWATVLGFLRSLTAQQTVTWERTAGPFAAGAPN
jgi:poly-beta-1,6-N-acetyl-D-glucosamine synthase